MGIYYNIPKAIFYLLEGDYTELFMRLSVNAYSKDGVRYFGIYSDAPRSIVAKLEPPVIQQNYLKLAAGACMPVAKLRSLCAEALATTKART